ncbi:MAG: preprotein translocase subunit SecY [Alphaproteobacteria bacterium]|nr:preprotein translocase subunit SecY [Alphaproteobacteria bacterium]
MVSMSEKMASSIDFSSFSKAKDLQKRLLFTLFALIVFRLGTYVTIPGVNPSALSEFFSDKSGGLIGMFNSFTGGALSRMSIFVLNIIPYITASILIQMASFIFPQLGTLRKEGASGMQKLNQYTRYLTVLMTTIQAFGMAKTLEAGGAVIMPSHFMFELSTVVSVLGGTMFVVWLSDQITARGVGNGSSLLITIGIVSGIPGAFARLLEEGRAGAISTWVLFAVAFIVFAVIYLVVLFERAQRRIIVQYPKRQMGMRMAQASSSYLPLKINPVGVMPPIFASTLLGIPTMIATFFHGDNFFLRAMNMLLQEKWLYMSVFAALIVFFTFFYASLQPSTNPDEIADNLKKQGGFVAGIRPGKNTAEYLGFVMTRLLVLGALYLVALCVLPMVLTSTMNIPFALGGTSLLIVVSVTMDTVSQIQSHLIAHQYEGLIKKARLKGRF